MLSSELQEFRVYLTHHVTPRGKTLLRNSSLSSCPAPGFSSASSGEGRTTNCSHTFKGHTVMTTPEITGSIPHLVSSRSLGLLRNKEESSKGIYGSYRVQTLPCKLGMPAALGICLIYLDSETCMLVSLQLAFGDPKAEGTGSSQHRLNGGEICHTA